MKGAHVARNPDTMIVLGNRHVHVQALETVLEAEEDKVHLPFRLADTRKSDPMDFSSAMRLMSDEA